jgi:hypothetical protein
MNGIQYSSFFNVVTALLVAGNFVLAEFMVSSQGI